MVGSPLDTGFVCAHRGWTALRPGDLGQLWEHFVLNEILAHKQAAGMRYWRDKQGHEVDFVWAPRRGRLTAIECKWSARDFEPGSLKVFARVYPEVRCWVVSTDANPAFERDFGGLRVEFVTLAEAVRRL